MVRVVAKLVTAILGCLVTFGVTGSATAGVREQGANLYTTTKVWSPLNYNNEWTAVIDPYSVFKVNEKDWDVNISFINNQNQYDPEQTFTYRIDCQNLKFQAQGWRINGVLKEYKGPLGTWLMNPTRTKIPPGSIMWTAKEYVCGVSHSISTYYWANSWFRDNQMKGTIDQIWFKDNVVSISPDDRSLRRANLMISVLGGTQPNFTEFFVKCDNREMMEATNGAITTDWTPIPAASGVEVLLEKMCSDSFNSIAYETAQITLPAPQPAPAKEDILEAGSNNELNTSTNQNKNRRPSFRNSSKKSPGCQNCKSKKDKIGPNRPK